MSIAEPAVTWTDFGLAAECALFSFLALRRGGSGNAYRLWFGLFFGSLGFAALAGGAVHGFFTVEGAPMYEAVWRLSLTALGASALAAWVIGAKILFPAGPSRWIGTAATVEFTVYGLGIWFYSQNFRIAIANYLPAVVFLLGGFLFSFHRTRDRRMALGSIGLALSLLASWVQQHRVALHPVYFDHNAFYHLIQFVAVFLIFLAAGRLVAIRDDGGNFSDRMP